MTLPEAKTLLSTHRPGLDPVEPAVAEALQLVAEQPELKEWYELNSAFQRSVRHTLRHLPVPQDLKRRLLAQPRILRPSFSWPPRPPLSSSP
jgi:hypothetical protein